MTSASTPHLQAEDFDELESLLDALRANDDDIPQWEYCEGFMVAALCTRRTISQEELFSALLGQQPGTLAPFADAAQQARFVELWQRRAQEVLTSLDSKVESLEDETAYHPEVMDVRGALAALPPEQQGDFDEESIPSFAQVWALGFMDAVNTWSDDWTPPRDKEQAEWLDEALAAIIALTEADTEPPEVSPFGGDEGEDAPPSVSMQRIHDFGDALWSVYDLREFWKSMGPKISPVQREATPGRNDLCHCGSGKKFKKCHGAG
jgi:uncharacterized protein